jgi:hypothetical protein
MAHWGRTMSSASDMFTRAYGAPWTEQNGVTIYAKVRDGAEALLIDELGSIGDKVAASGAPFAQSERIHYARFVFIRGDIDPIGESVGAGLMYLADFDGGVEEHLAELVKIASGELVRVGQHLEEQILGGPAEQLGWLRQHSIANAAYYVNTIGRTVQQIRSEAYLRERIEKFLDGANLAACAPATVRLMIQNFVRSAPELEWSCEPAASGFAWQLKKSLALVVGGMIAVALIIVLVPLSILWALVLRCHEDLDPDDPTRPDQDHVAILARAEDRTLQNQFSALGFVKPGRFRRVNAAVILWAGKFITRYLFSHEDLAGVKTIHFARWTFIEGKRRMLFSSNYDGSLENYMGDFIDLVWWGLNAIFSNGVGYPRTRWAFFGGAKDEGAFKRHIRNRQITTQVWYAAYPNISAMNIVANARIRAGLFGRQSDTGTQAWLSLL